MPAEPRRVSPATRNAALPAQHAHHRHQSPRPPSSRLRRVLWVCRGGRDRSPTSCRPAGLRHCAASVEDFGARMQRLTSEQQSQAFPSASQAAFAPAASLSVGPDWNGNEAAFTLPGPTPDAFRSTYTAPRPPPASAAATAAASDPRSLSHPRWKLRPEVRLGLRDAGIETMYAWQAECLGLAGLLDGTRNVVYTAPTSAGKSLVADLLVVRKVVEERKKAIVVLPYIAIVQEKTRFLKQVLAKMMVPVARRHEKQAQRWRPVTVVGFHSGARSRIGWKELDIAVCTIEKANTLVNAAVEDHTVDSLGIVIFDELHMVEDASRGYILEVLATKLLCLEGPKIQIVGMSATLSNVRVLAKWLRAHAYECTFRPVPLQEYLVYDNSVRTYDHELAMNIPPSDIKELADPVINAIVTLAYEAVAANHGVLVFCESRKKCEDLALLLLMTLPRAAGDLLEHRLNVVRALATTPTGLDFTLEKTVPAGIAFHHAGLTSEERDILAAAYDVGHLKVIFCTPTMAAGVNLPARRVIITPRTGREFLKPSMLRQMRGRAGRAGRDTHGESFLVCRREELPQVQALLAADMPAVTSCLAAGDEASNNGLARALLEIVATRLATSAFSIDDYFQNTLLHHTHPSPPALPGLLAGAIASLKAADLIRDEGGSGGFLAATPTGRATVAAGLPPREGVFLHAELSRALGSFNLETDLHMVYCFTPTHTTTREAGAAPDWRHMLRALERFGEADLRAARCIGVSPATVTKLALGTTGFRDGDAGDEARARTYRRFWVALMLRELIAEAPVHAVADGFGVARGFVQGLAGSARGFAGTSAAFCRAMGWTGLAVLLDHYAWRLEAGVRDELASLARLPFVKSATARVFWDRGLRSVDDVAAAAPAAVQECLRLARPRQLRRRGAEEAHLRRREAERAAVVKRAAEALWEQEQELRRRAEEDSDA